MDGEAYNDAGTIVRGAGDAFNLGAGASYGGRGGNGEQPTNAPYGFLEDASFLGAGGGGFLLFFVEPKDQRAVADSLKDLYQLPFQFDNAGTRITYYDQGPI